MTLLKEMGGGERNNERYSVRDPVTRGGGYSRRAKII